MTDTAHTRAQALLARHAPLDFDVQSAEAELDKLLGGRACLNRSAKTNCRSAGVGQAVMQPDVGRWEQLDICDTAIAARVVRIGSTLAKLDLGIEEERWLRIELALVAGNALAGWRRYWNSGALLPDRVKVRW